MRDIWESEYLTIMKDIPVFIADYWSLSNIIIMCFTYTTASKILLIAAGFNILFLILGILRLLGVENMFFIRAARLIHKKEASMILFLLGPTMVDFFIKITTCELKDEIAYWSRHFPENQCYTTTYSFLMIGTAYLGVVSLMINVFFSLYFSFQRSFRCNSTCQRRTLDPELTIFASISILFIVSEIGGRDSALIISLGLIFSLGIALKQMTGGYHVTSNKERKITSFGVAMGLWFSIGQLTSLILLGTSLHSNTLPIFEASSLLVLIIIFMKVDTSELKLLYIDCSSYEGGTRQLEYLEFLVRLAISKSTDKDEVVYLNGFYSYHVRNCDNDGCLLRQLIVGNKTSKSRKGEEEQLRDAFKTFILFEYTKFLKLSPNSAEIRLSLSYFLLEVIQKRNRH